MIGYLYIVVVLSTWVAIFFLEKKRRKLDAERMELEFELGIMYTFESAKDERYQDCKTFNDIVSLVKQIRSEQNLLMDNKIERPQ